MNLTLNRHKLAIVGGVEPTGELINQVSLAARSVGVLIAVNSDDPNKSMHGTAICVDSSGLFLTARHYVMDLSARLVLDREYAAEPVAVDDERDLILFAVKEPLIEAPLPLLFAAAPPPAGTPVVGVGHVVAEGGYKLGAYGASYLDRWVDVSDPGQHNGVPSDWLECALVFEGSHLKVPGFSGGPILQADGSVVALTSFGDGDSCIVGPSGAAARELVEWYRNRS